MVSGRQVFWIIPSLVVALLSSFSALDFPSRQASSVRYVARGIQSF